MVAWILIIGVIVATVVIAVTFLIKGTEKDDNDSSYDPNDG